MGVKFITNFIVGKLHHSMNLEVKDLKHFLLDLVPVYQDL